MKTDIQNKNFTLRIENGPLETREISIILEPFSELSNSSSAKYLCNKFVNLRVRSVVDRARELHIASGRSYVSEPASPRCGAEVARAIYK